MHTNTDTHTEGQLTILLANIPQGSIPQGSIPPANIPQAITLHRQRAIHRGSTRPLGHIHPQGYIRGDIRPVPTPRGLIRPPKHHIHREGAPIKPTRGSSLIRRLGTKKA